MSEQPIRALLVEDNPTDRLLIHEALMALSVAQFELADVERLANALQQLRQAEFDVVLLDLGLPDSQGLATLVTLQKHAPRTPIIVLTDLADEALGLRAVQAGAQDYLVKGHVAGGGLARAIRYAIERKRAEAAQRFLAAAGTLLAASLDDATTLDRVAQLAVPDLADWCVVHLLETDGTIHRLALAHVDPARAALVRARPDRYPLDPHAQHLVPHVIHTGRPELCPETSDALLLASARDAEHLETLRWLGLASYICVPLVLQGRTFGAITLALGESRRRYGPDDLALAEELARRTAIALDNVQLYQRAQTEIAERQRVEATLRESQERLAGIVGSAMDAIISIDAAQRIVVFNTAAEQMFGCSAAAALGQPIDRFVPPRFRSVHAAHIRAFGQTGVTSRSMRSPGKLTALRADGSEFPIEATISQTVAAGQPLYTVIMRDISARTQADAALRASEDRYRQIVETAQEGIWQIDAANNTTFVNAKLAAILGYTADAMIGAPLFAFIAAEDQAIATANIERRRKGIAEQHDFKFLRKDGAAVWTLISTNPLQDDAGNYAGALAMVTDITDRKRAELALRQSEQRFATAFRANPAAMSITRIHDGCFIDINASHERLFGYQRDELIGQRADTTGIYANPDQRAEVVRLIREHGSLREAELTLRTKSGELREVLCSLELLELDGEACMLGSVFDITDRKRAETAMERSADRLRVLADASAAIAEAGTEYQTLLDQVARTTATVLGEGCNIRLLSDDAAWLHVVALYDGDPEKLELTRMVLGKAPLGVDEPSLATRIFHSRQPLLIPVVDREQLRTATKPAYWPLVDRLGLRSMIVVPMRVHGRAIGVLILYRRRPEQPPFDEDDLTLAQDLADRAALAISNARLYNELQQSHAALETRVAARTAELAHANATLAREVAERTQLGLQLQQQATQATALATLSQALAEAGRDLQPLFDTIVQRVAGLTGDTCVLSLLSADGQWMHPVASHSSDTERTALLRTLLAGAPNRADAGWSAAVVASGQALLLPHVLIKDARAEIDPRYHPYLETLDALSLLIVPLRAHTTLLGTLSVVRDQAAQPYSADDQAFLQNLADRAGLAIENAHLFAETEQARGEAERANHAKSAFLSSMSHELRTPLNAILGFAGTLLMQLPGPLNAEQEKQLTTVQRSGKHLLALINDLLDLAKIESGKVELSLAPLVCQDVIAEVADSLRPLAERKGLAFSVIAPAEPLVVASDHRALGQILINLVNNAIKFTDAGDVRIELVRELPRVDGGPPAVIVRVSDTGIGIKAEDQAKLFAEFGRVDSAAVRAREGTGLGLRLSRKLAELLGGTIELRSEFGKGSTFTLVLRDSNGNEQHPHGRVRYQ